MSAWDRIGAAIDVGARVTQALVTPTHVILSWTRTADAGAYPVARATLHRTGDPPIPPMQVRGHQVAILRDQPIPPWEIRGSDAHGWWDAPAASGM